MSSTPIYDFKNGDRIICAKQIDHIKPGETATIVQYENYTSALVNLDTFRLMQHSGDGRCDNGHGWWVNLWYFKPLIEDVNFTYCSKEFDSLL